MNNPASNFGVFVPIFLPLCIQLYFPYNIYSRFCAIARRIKWPLSRSSTFSERCMRLLVLAKFLAANERALAHTITRQLANPPNRIVTIE